MKRRRVTIVAHADQPVKPAPVVEPGPEPPHPVEPEQAAGSVIVSNDRGRIVAGVPYAQYAKIPAQNVSPLKEMCRSALHFKHRLANPKTTDALRLGTAAHCAALEPERFARDFVVWEKRAKSGNMAARSGDEWDAFEAAALASGHEIITPAQRDAALTIAKAVRASADAWKYLRAGHAEVTMEWAHDEPPMRLKGRADWLTTIGGVDVVVGLKTARDCRPREFARQAAQLGYHLQWSYYHDGFRRITRRDPVMVEIVVESVEPHAVAVYVVDDDVMDLGRGEYQAALEHLDECQRSGVWPGPVVGEQTLAFPGWAFGNPEEMVIEDAGDKA